MALPPINHLELCAGIGGLGLGLKLADPRIRTVGYVEREAYCAALLVARMEDAALDCAPVWDDLTTFDGGPWRGSVDIISAGFPCQPWSCAGKRGGISDARWIWPEIARIIGEVGPWRVFLENVPGLIRGGLGLVLSDLAEMGYDAVWGCFRASDAGATHRRERVFVLADAEIGRTRRRPGHDDSAWPDTFRGNAQLADAERGGIGGGDQPRLGAARRQADKSANRAGLTDEPGNRGEALADAARLRQRKPDNAPGAKPRQGAWEAAGRRSGGLPAFPPGPGDFDAWERILAAFPDLAPAVEPGVRGMVDGISDRLDRLRALGNAVVPQQAALAYQTLSEILNERR